MRLRTSCHMTFEITVPAPFVLMLRPRTGAQQLVLYSEYHLAPSIPMTEFTDNFGNLCQRLTAPAGDFGLHAFAVVEIADAVDRAPGAPYVEVQDLPDDMLSYLLPSRYCESDRFIDMAAEITENVQPGYDQVAAIENWLRETIRYEPGSSDRPYTAVEVSTRTAAVCRDLAHLGIALSRAICVPSRMVVGYLHGLEPMDMHAWFEAYVGGRWYTFDATQREVTGGYVVIGYGRDAADVAIYNQYGPPVYPKTQDIQVARLDQ